MRIETYHVSFCPIFEAGIGLEPFCSRSPEDYEPHPLDPNRRAGGYVFEEGRAAILKQLHAWHASMPVDGSPLPYELGPGMKTKNDASYWIYYWTHTTEDQEFPKEADDGL